jgi:hypothetical protein
VRGLHARHMLPHGYSIPPFRPCRCALFCRFGPLYCRLNACICYIGCTCPDSCFASRHRGGDNLSDSVLLSSREYDHRCATSPVSCGVVLPARWSRRRTAVPRRVRTCLFIEDLTRHTMHVFAFAFCRPLNPYDRVRASLFRARSYCPTLGMSTALACAAGTFNPFVGANSSAACQPCAAGRYSWLVGANASSSCQPCAAGRYSWLVGANASSSCQPCAGGMFSSIVGANSSAVCQLCPAGASCAAGAAVPVMCAPGSFALASSVICPACPVGTYSELAGANSSTACRMCPAGLLATLDHSKCVPTCPPGAFRSADASFQCTSCIGGMFCPGGDDPIACPAGMHQIDVRLVCTSIIQFSMRCLS